MSFLTKGKTNWKYVIIVAFTAIISSLLIIWKIRGMDYLYQQVPLNTYQKTTSENAKKTLTNTKSTKIFEKNLSYNDALKLYADHRIQFDSNCIMTPNYVVFKKGAKVMLDNRYDKQRSVYLDGAPYYLGAYGFKIITLIASATLPHTIRVDCGTGKNNGRIILQQ